MSDVEYGLVNKILPYSFVDGPGNRSVVFLQGCNFQCLYCHNPYTIQICNNCGVCVAKCPTGALSINNGQVEWQQVDCILCDSCIEFCPNWSSPRTQRLSVGETWQIIKDYVPFISGITVSGGEPTQQPKYLYGLLSFIKDQTNLTTCIETNGAILAEVLELLLPVIDYAMIDFKVFDPLIHHKLTEAENVSTLNSIKRLAEAGKLHMVRTVVVPGITDTIQNTQATAKFLADIDPNIHLRLLRFRAHGVKGVASNWESPSDECMDRLVEIGLEEGLKQVDRSI